MKQTTLKYNAVESRALVLILHVPNEQAFVRIVASGCRELCRFGDLKGRTNFVAFVLDW